MLDSGRTATQDVDTAVRQALEGLSPLDRDVFLMREMGGLGYADIAAACETTVDAVRSRIHRTRLALRAQLAGPISGLRTQAVTRSGRSETGDDR